MGKRKLMATVVIVVEGNEQILNVRTNCETEYVYTYTFVIAEPKDNNRRLELEPEKIKWHNEYDSKRTLTSKRYLRQERFSCSFFIILIIDCNYVFV